MTEQEIKAWSDEYVRHMDEWLAGHSALMPMSEFIGQKIAAKLVEQYMAEQGLLAA